MTIIHNRLSLSGTTLTFGKTATRSRLIFLFGTMLLLMNAHAEVIYVSSQAEFNAAHDDATMGDTIAWRAGTYADIYMEISNDHLYITAETLGATIFTGASRVNITGDHLTFAGFQFLDGDIGTRDVINIRGSHILFTQINIHGYTSYKYLRVREESQYVDITHCNFENRLNLDDQNILSILVDADHPGYHKIQYCSFKNFAGSGNDLGIEPIRIGLSTQADRISRTLVEYCYFTKCDGDGELISSKATQNVYRFNTFENNPKAELVLRHGSKAIVYGNFFLNGKGGVRVREGQDHYIYNNYFFELDDRVIYLQNEPSDPLDNINIGFNTVVDCSEIILGGDGNNKPTNVTFANNIFADPDDVLFEEPTNLETWIGNIAFGTLGINQVPNGITVTDPQLEENSKGYWGLTESSPAIDAAQPGYAPLPHFDGIADIDTTLVFDLMGQLRPAAISEKDLGCNEHPHMIPIQPLATEENTGPAYLMTTALNNGPAIVKNLIRISPNPVSSQLQITLLSNNPADITLEIFDLAGRRIDTILHNQRISETLSFSQDVTYLLPGSYTLRATKRDMQGKRAMQIVKFVKQ